LLEEIDADQLPVHWGGTATDADGDPCCKSQVDLLYHCNAFQTCILYFRQGEGCVINAVCLSFLHSASVQDYYKSSQPASSHLDVMTGLTSQKNLLTIGDPVSDRY